MQELFRYLAVNKDLSVTSRECISALETLVTHDTVAGFLRGVLASEDLLNEFTAQSYVHQLGFEKYILFSDGVANGKRIRLHVWPPETKVSRESELHDHRHDFASKVLAGELHHKCYNISSPGVDYQLFHYEIDNATRVSYQTHVGPVKANMTDDWTAFQGTSYSMKNDVVHSMTVPGSSLTLSVLIEGPTVKDVARVCKSYSVSTSEQSGIGLRELRRSEIAFRFEHILRTLSQV